MYEPLETMITTGGARLDREGVIVVSGEYVAALYESYVAEHEWNEGGTYSVRPQSMPAGHHGYTMAEYGQSLESLGRYCTAAEVATEDLWTRDLESVQE